MATCPNKNLQEWKDLENAVGELKAYYYWDKHKAGIPANILSGERTLDERLENDFLDDYKFEIKRYPSIQDALNYDDDQIVDLLERVIQIDKDTPLDKATAYIAFRLLGKENNKLRSNLRLRIRSWDKYNDKFEKFKNEYNYDNKKFANKTEWRRSIVEKIIVDYLDETIVAYDKNPISFEAINDRKWTRADFTDFKKLIMKIKDFLWRNANITFRTKKGDNIVLNTIGAQIADEILNNKFDLFKYELTQDQILKGYEDTIENDSFAQEIVDYFQSKGIILTGSLALRKMGTVYRTVKESLHDLDFIVPFKLNSSKENKTAFDLMLKHQNNNSELDITVSTKVAIGQAEELDWHKEFVKKYPGYKIVNGFYGGARANDFKVFTLTGSIDGEYYQSDGKHEEKNSEGTVFIVEHKKGDWIKNTGYVIDHFINFTPENEVHTDFFQYWKNIMVAKLMMGRAKDMADWIAFVPFTKGSELEKFKYPDYVFNNKNSVGKEVNSIPNSRASEKTIDAIKIAIEQMGISMVSLETYAKENPNINIKGVAGLADLVKRVIAISQGKESETLTEEMVHIATAILEQTNPKLITEMISKIDRFTIYKKVLKSYSQSKLYQLENGKPNIRKIKKEAVDKLIVELIIKNNQGSTEYPELLELETRTYIQKIWDAILDAFSRMYKKTDIDIFKEASQIIMSDGAGKANMITSEGVYLQIDTNPNIGLNKAVDAVYDKLFEVDSNMKLVLETLNPDNTIKKKRHYIIKETTGELVEVLQSVTEKLKAKKEERFPINRTKLQETIDNYKKDWGTAGHYFIYKFITTNLIDKDGFALDVPNTDEIETELEDDIAFKIEQFAKNLINSYPEGTRFLLETQVTNKNRSLGSAIDFTAIIPKKNDNNEDSYSVDIFDWKFTSVNEKEYTDIPWYKQENWTDQMTDYVNIFSDYGIKINNIRKSRMIPFIVTYEDVVPLSPEFGVYPALLRINDINNVDKNDVYTLPVPTRSEKTGYTVVDNLVKALYSYKENLYSKYDPNINKQQKKNSILNDLSLAIRKLQVALDFSPLVNIGMSFIKTSKDALTEFDNIDYTKLSLKELNNKLEDLLIILNSGEKFKNLDKIFLDVYSENMSKEDKILLERLETLASQTRKLFERVKNHQENAAFQIAYLTDFSKENAKDLLSAEREVNVISRSFLEASVLPVKLLQVGVNLLLKAKKLVDVKFIKEMNSFKEILATLEKEAQSKGVSAFSMIGQVMKNDLRLIYKVDKKFIDDLNKARKDKNKKFLKDNIDLDAFNKDVQDYITIQNQYIDDGVFDPNNEENDDRIKTYRKRSIKKSVDINLKEFQGWNDYTFISLINKHRKEDNHLSKEYIEMSKSSAALAMWNYFTELNNKARDNGYLNKKTHAFLPLIEATIIQKFAASDNNFFVDSKEVFKDLFIARIEEKKSFGNIDPETKKLKTEIPRYFTSTDKRVNQLSQDLGKMGALYTKAVLEFESSSNLENVMQTLYQLQLEKESFVEDDKGNLVKDANDIFIKKESNNNATIFKAFMDDGIYGITDDGLINSSSIKKGIQSANTYITMQGVGLKLPIAIANWVGASFQAFINGGVVYSFSEFEANHARILTNQLSTNQRALLHAYAGLNEDIVLEERRRNALKTSFKDYVNTWTFNDAMQATNFFPDKLIQLANAASFNENTMIIDGAFVNINQYVKAQDRKAREGLSFQERQELAKTQKERIAELKSTSSIDKIITVDDKGINFPTGMEVSDEAIAKYSVKIQDFARKLNGQMDINNKAAYRRNIIFKSFMMFKTWVPKMLSERYSDIHYNNEQANWEYGRSRLYVSTLRKLGYANIFRMKHILLGTEEGIKIMDEILEAKKEAYFLAYGQKLRITNEEFYDLMNQELTNQIKELNLLVGITLAVLSFSAAEPPENATLAEKNRYKYWAKVFAKIKDEISFYYNPFTFQSITKGSILPSLNLLTTVGTAFTALAKEGGGYILDDQEMIDKAYPLKYFINLAPIGQQFQNGLLPYLAPEIAKDMGVRTTKESRRN